MRRREFIAGLGVAVAWPGIIRAAQSSLPVIGFLNGGSAWEYAHVVAAFQQGLREAGYEEGRNVVIEYRWAEGHYERLSALATDLVRRQVAVIVGNTPSAMAAKRATTAIPIIFFTAVDPVKQGLVASLSRPGGNATGVSNLSVEVGPKQLQLLRELVPTTSVVAVLVNQTSPEIAETARKDAEGASHSLKLRVLVVTASNEHELEETFGRLGQLGVGGLLVSPDPFFNSRRDQIVVLASRHGVPTIYNLREFATAGGLCSYGASITDAARQTGVYAGKVLSGAKPSDLPVQQPTKLELVLNLKTARALGLNVPPTLLARADEVIE